MRWPWTRRRSPSFKTVVQYNPGTAVNVVAYGLSRPSIGAPPRSAHVVLDVWRADGQVCNGGFSQLVFNDHRIGRGLAVRDYAAAFETLGAREAVALFAEVADWCDREKAVVERLCAGTLFGDPLVELFRGFADRYFPLSRHIRRLAVDYMIARDEPWYDAATREANEKETLRQTAAIAIDSAMVYAHVGLLRHALDVGVDLATYRGFDGGCVLHEVSDDHDEEFVEVLLDAGAPIDVPDKRGDLPLHHAARRSATFARLLLARGASPTARGAYGMQPLHSAGAEVTEMLLAAGADPRARADNGLTPLHMPRTVDAIDQLLAAGADPRAVTSDGNTVLHSMAARGTSELVAKMIAVGLDPNARDTRGRVPLHDVRSEDAIEVLVAAGADIESRDAKGRTPLMTADHLPVVAALLAKGARVDATDDQGRSPLHFPRWQEGILDLLLAAGASLDVRDRHGRTPLEHARHARARTAAEEKRTDDLPYGEDDHAWVNVLGEDACYCQDRWVHALEAASRSAAPRPN